jgi:hypothetical protein
VVEENPASKEVPLPALKTAALNHSAKLALKRLERFIVIYI